MKKPLLATYAINKSIPQLTNEDIKRLDVIYYAFIRVDGRTVDISEMTNIGRIKEIKEINPEIKVILTAASGDKGGFNETFLKDSEFKICAKKLVDEVEKYGFDGLDIDWEYPTTKGNPDERHGHTLLMKALREELDSRNKGYQLSIAAGCKHWYFEITELTESVKYLDYVNLMTYDINANNEYTVHHTCTYKMDTDKETVGSCKENIDCFIENGVPKEKLIIGAAFYSRQWKNVKNENNGLFAFSGEASDYGPGYTQLEKEFVNKNGYTRYWDDNAKAPYLFNGDNFITYDDEESLYHKCQCVKNSEIAGIMIWEYSYDEEHKLVKVMKDSLQ